MWPVYYTYSQHERGMAMHGGVAKWGEGDVSTPSRLWRLFVIVVRLH